jgi:GTPase SAR1 family protein
MSLTPSVNTPLFLFKTFVWGDGGVGKCFFINQLYDIEKFAGFFQKIKKTVEFTLEKPFSKIYPNIFVNKITKFVKKIIHSGEGV